MAQQPAASAAGSSLFFDHALLPAGWARDVRVTIRDGAIAAVEADAKADGGRMAGIALPGLPNLHCHTFQRAMAGLAERRGPAHDSFWTWREVMYRFLGRLSPEDIEAISAFAYMEMLERGFTSVAEFHYLHHAPDGQPYADLGEMAARIAEAASETGIGLTLLPSFYTYGGFGGAPAAPGQRRFLNDPDRFLKLVERTRAIVAPIPSARVGIAPHSLRAVTPETLKQVVAATPNGPIHIHAAEQTKEVEDCVAWSKSRPVQWLLDEMAVDRRWCLIHATHMTKDETQRLAQSGAVAGLCPLTEASLGDGFFNGPEFLESGGRFGVGTDSNIDIDAAVELRQLEYSQRLLHRGRNVMTTVEGESTGRRLFTQALAGGAQALQRECGAIAVGKRADLVVLDSDQPDLAAAKDDVWLDAWIFVAGRAAVKDVFVDGRQVVADGRHHARDASEKRYRATLAKLSTA
jgi:formimidoylglutamate deiminase